MHAPNIDRLDLNLLRVLDALLSEGQVSRAARRLRMSQPATSRALSRLRDALGDPLLVRAHRGMVPTERGRALHQPVQQLLAQLRNTLSEPTLSPQAQHRSFAITATDYASELLLPPTLRLLQTAAPNYVICAHAVTDHVASALEQGTISLTLMPRHKVPAGLRQLKLIEDKFTCLVSRHQKQFGRALSLDQFCSAGHVTVGFGSVGQYVADPVDTVLQRLGRQRITRAQVESFVLAASIAQATDLVLTVPVLLATRLAKRMQVRMVDPPTRFPGFQYCLVWHERAQHDPCHQLLREQFRLAASCLRTAT